METMTDPVGGILDEMEENMQEIISESVRHATIVAPTERRLQLCVSFSVAHTPRTFTESTWACQRSVATRTASAEVTRLGWLLLQEVGTIKRSCGVDEEHNMRMKRLADCSPKWSRRRQRT